MTGDDLLPEYNPECITMVTDLLTPDRVNFMWLSKNFSSECNTQEKWFGVNYSVHGKGQMLSQCKHVSLLSLLVMGYPYTLLRYFLPLLQASSR